jgi:MFS family permease
MLFVFGGIANAVVQGALVGRLVQRFGEQKLAPASLAIQALAFVAIIAAPAYWTLYLIIVFSSAGTALIWPTMGALTANQVPPHEQGQVSGVSTSLGSLMSVFGPLWAGAVYDQFAPAAPYWTGVILFALAVVVLARVRVASPHG